ncbi:transposase domain-containing protein, partial [Burkholderia multivorans]|uniref:transposase domain-containing protein n=1 Tax=Burkholderia multivorans TaxID=87883 RepID=UPI002870509E
VVISQCVGHLPRSQQTHKAQSVAKSGSALGHRHFLHEKYDYPYTLVETCKANSIDPYRYLTWLFQRLPLAKTVDDYEALLPWKMPADLR